MSDRNRLAALWGDEPSNTARSLIALLRADLASADYTVAGIDALWERHAAQVHAGAALRRGHRVPAERALRSETESPALATLVRCFLLGLPVERGALAGALPTAGVGGAETLGIVASARGDRDVVVPLVELRHHAFADEAGTDEWWIASDLGELARGDALAEDHVLGVGGAATTLSGLLLPRHSTNTLDVGTGSGIQAMHAARFSDRVVATDISERALAFARFTAALNGIEHIEFRLGSLFEPVAGQRFDRIVSNPPFVITPRLPGVPAYEYRDGGMIGDGIVEAVIRGAAEHLAPGGIAQLLANWEIRESPGGEPHGLERVADWLEGSGLDFWIIERERQDPSEYAETWIRDGGTKPGTAEFERLHAAWLDDFADRGVTGVGFGYVLLRAPAPGAPPRIARLERVTGAVSSGNGTLGDHLDHVLAAVDRLATIDDDTLRSISVVTAPDVTEERHHWPGEDSPTVILLRQGGGLGRTIDAGTALAALVGASDGSMSLGVTSDAIAQLLEVDAGELWAELAPMVRDLVFGGLLEPV